MAILKMEEEKEKEKFGSSEKSKTKCLLDDTNVYVGNANKDLYFYPHGLNVKAIVGESCFFYKHQ